MEAMKHLYKHKLDFEYAWPYVEDQLSDMNTLSSTILNIVKFKEGFFFTLLPKDANLQEIYSFKCGGILPQFPEEENIINGVKSTFSWIPNIRFEIASLISREFFLKQNINCIIDNITGSSNDKYYQLYIDNFSHFFNEEVYFIFTKNNFSFENLLRCLKFSNSFWHSLCVLTRVNLSDMNKKLSDEKIKDICLASELIMVGAYDGEGYVFWEKKQINKNNSFFPL